MHSPWGVMYTLVKDTGWSWHDIMWTVTRPNLLLMMADKPGIKRKKETKKVKTSAVRDQLSKRFKL